MIALCALTRHSVQSYQRLGLKDYKAALLYFLAISYIASFPARVGNQG